MYGHQSSERRQRSLFTHSVNRKNSNKTRWTLSLSRICVFTWPTGDFIGFDTKKVAHLFGADLLAIDSVCYKGYSNCAL